jgi:hypothetical protein
VYLFEKPNKREHQVDQIGSFAGFVPIPPKDKMSKKIMKLRSFRPEFYILI